MLCVLLGCGVLWPCLFYAAEPWADERLTVKDGLELWFDCSRQNAGRSELQLPPLASENETDYLIDGSGHRRHLAQPAGNERPIFRQAFSGAFLSFDGVKDVLYASNLRDEFSNATIFVVAKARTNKGNYPCFFSMGSAGQNDYRSGLNGDLGAAATAQVSFLNVEGSGMSGAVNLLKSVLPFGDWHVFSLETAPGAQGARLFLDGVLQKARDRDASVIHLDDFALGARHYSNAGPAPFLQGFFSGAIAEFLLYNRSLTDAERTAVGAYLNRKYGALLDRRPELSGEAKALITVTNPPAVQMLVPGFTVRPFPLSLPNINDVKYRPDGKLVALGYNGQIYLLSDTNRNGLENHVDLFWTNSSLRAPIGMALTPPGYARGQGVFVAAKGKLSLIVDTNGDDRADEEIIVAEGWKELSHGVDALGVAIDHDGNIFFGLGTPSFTNPYLIDKATGEAGYDIHGERGTILKVSPDFKRRQIFCTGIRFSVALAINSLGDLFCTDQEGATWLPNGNPLDELLFIQEGRHYGFPPAHPKYLHNVIDEPSVFDYGPQHQSTCGLNFNNSVNGGPVFGPAWWSDNAVVSGYSRGKIWRTELVRTDAGYVARNRLIAALSALTVDACVSPRGDLVVSTHSGDPDWGTGPDGHGHLYKISYTDPTAPQPVMTWSSSPSEIRIAFDRPLKPESLRNLASRVEITQGQYVSAGDRFETVRPGYAAVFAQLSEPRFNVPVTATSLSADQRTLILNTQPRYAGVNYSITLAGWNMPGLSLPEAIPQYPDIEMTSDLAGLQADWSPATADGSITSLPWHGWLPHVDLEVAQRFTEGSAEHQAFWLDLQKPGLLALRGQLNLWEMLQPAIQPGAKLDYERPPEEVTVVFGAAAPFDFEFEHKAFQSESTDTGRQQVTVHHRSQQAWLPFALTIETHEKPLALTAIWFTAQDPRPRAFPLRRFLLPWAEPNGAASLSQPRPPPPELAGGDWLQGRNIYFSQAVNCQRCHTIRGEGHHVGPDLSNLIYRDYTSVLRDIQQPSAAINPDFLAYNIELRDGNDLTAVLQTETHDQITVVDGNDQTSVLRKDHIKSMKASAISFMPEGLIKGLTARQVKDLMTFLLTSPLEPATLDIPGAPAPRKEAVVEELLKHNPAEAAAQKPAHSSLNIVLCAGPKDHGPSEHDYPLWQKRWSALLALKDGVKTSTAWEWPSAEQWQTANVIVFYSDNPGWNQEREHELEAYLDRGGGAVFIHFAVDGHDHVSGLAQIIGLAWQGGVSKFRHGHLDLKIEPSPVSPNLSSIEFIDESYWNLVGNLVGAQVVASSVEDGAARPQIWMRPYGKGRVFVCLPGHYTWTLDDPLYRLLLLRGICWAGGQPADYLSGLVSVGARIAN
jgi:putative heme-binding domain-containing protein